MNTKTPVSSCHIPWWKRVWSYVTPLYIESTETAENGVIVLEYHRGQFRLCTHNAIYSYGLHYNNFVQAFRQMDIELFKGGDILLLGAGMGSILEILERQHQLNGYYTCVEHDEEICSMLETYILPSYRNPVEVIAADVHGFLAFNRKKYDIVCMDIFQDAEVPDDCLTPEFCQLLASCLKAGGVCLFNHIALRELQEQKAMQYFEKVFRVVFPEAQALKIRYNILLISTGRCLRSV